MRNRLRGTLVLALAASGCGQASVNVGAESAPPCNTAADCERGWLCVDGGCFQPCNRDSECAKADSCAVGVCQRINHVCARNDECGSPAPCERLNDAYCEGGLCHYPAVTCTQPTPVNPCRVTRGTCVPQPGSCTDVSCCEYALAWTPPSVPPACPFAGEDGNGNGQRDNGETWSGVCQADGGCGACIATVECDDSNACTIDVCDDQACKHDGASLQGTACAVQTSGDGVCVSVAADQGACLLVAGRACASGGECASTHCVCADDGCSTRACHDTGCVVCSFDGDGAGPCAATSAGRQGEGCAAAGEACNAAQSCVAGPGVSCMADAACGAAHCECVDAGCAERRCDSVACVCQLDAASDGTCDGPLADGLEDPEDCEAPSSCDGGVCKGLAGDGGACVDDADCSDAGFLRSCAGTTCRRDDGQACTQPADCVHTCSIDTCDFGVVDPFSFTDVSPGSGTSVTSNTVTLTGGFGSAAATCNAGCTGISINGGPFVAGPVTGVDSGDTIAIRQTPAAEVCSGGGATGTTTTASVTVGTVQSGTWSVTTPAATQTFTVNGTWTKLTTCPATTTVRVRCWGAGGGGAAASSSRGGGGGGGGGYATAIAVLGDFTATVPVTIGVGGAGGAGTAGGNGSTGGVSSFGLYTAGGGKMGTGLTCNGGGGLGGTGTYAGGSGGDNNCNYGGGGGGGAANMGGAGVGGTDGGNSSCSGGAGGAMGSGGGSGGSGGAAASTSLNSCIASPGASYGGGGGGGSRTATNTGGPGAAGANGLCEITTDQSMPYSELRFADQTPVPLGTTITSDTKMLGSGIVNATVTRGTGCTAISINGGAFVAGPVTGVNAGDTVAIRQVSSANHSTATTATVTVGTLTSIPWKVTTGVVDTFAFASQTVVNASTTLVSDTRTLTGGFANATATCGTGCTAISINGGAFVAGPVTGVNSGNTIAIRQTSSANGNTSTTARVTVGGRVSSSWSVTTFGDFADQAEVGPGLSITSDVVTLGSGFNNATATCGAGCTGISIGGGAFVAGPVTGVNSGNTIAIRQISSASGGTATTAVVTVGAATSTPWTVTTVAFGSHTFAYSGAVQSYLVAAGCTSITVKLWGGGGGGGSGGIGGGISGAGGFVTGKISGLTSGSTLDIVVGRGGDGGGPCFGGNAGSAATGDGGPGGQASCGYAANDGGGGGGGGASRISDSASVTILVAGGGGGASGGTTGPGNDGGGGGGASGADGVASCGNGGTNAGGGTQSAGGARDPALSGVIASTDGSLGAGGHGGSAWASPGSGGGGGGGGYYGGGGGGSAASATACGGGGGGGGSSYLGGGGYAVTGASTASGSNTLPGGSGDSSYQAGVGAVAPSVVNGSAASSGGNGLVVISCP